ncbi:hypothetical protein [Nocardia alni]|uniref:hypothetical protein n=1 Tax=Nocardia alni TaxID=2815723 RepID=UPI0027DFCCFD|nr:hypothetical protein [Nocardia alni]
MPDSELPATLAQSDPLGGLTPQVQAVIGRWNPQGEALLRAARGGASPATHEPVALFGPADASTVLLRTELARFEPRIDLADPVADPNAPGGPVAAPAVALVLLDAGAALGASTLGAVARLHSGNTRILFAMNGIHAHPDWRAVLQRNTALLTPALGADPRIVPVSGRLAVAARGSGDATLLDRSGLAQLHTQLTAAVGASPGPGRLAAVLSRVLADTRQRIHDQETELDAGAAVGRLRQERATLLAGRDGGRAQAMGELRNRMHLARVDLLHEAGARIRALNATARTEVDKLGRAGARTYPERLQQSVSELTGQLDGVLTYRLGELTRQLEAAVGTRSAATPFVPPRLRTDPAPRLGPDPEPRHRGVEDHLMIALGASGGFGLGRLAVAPLTLVPALNYATIPMSLLLGAAVAYWVVRARARIADRAHLRQWVSDALVNVKAQLEQRVTTALVEAESQFTDLLVRVTTARVVDNDRQIADLESQVRQLNSSRPAQLAACRRDLELLEALEATVIPQ